MQSLFNVFEWWPKWVIRDFCLDFLCFGKKASLAQLMHGFTPDIMENRQTRPSQIPPALVDARGLRILAKSVYRELKNSGHSRSDIVSFTNEMLELVTNELRQDAEAAE